MSDDYELLGAAEKHIAKQLREGFENSAAPLRNLVDKFETLAAVDWEAAMIDPKKKGTAVTMVDLVGKMPVRIADLSLVAMIAQAVFAKEEAAA